MARATDSLSQRGADELLREWQAEANAGRREFLLEQLLWTHARPVIARVLGRQWLTLQRASVADRDPEDLLQRVHLQLLRAMRRGGAGIESFIPYVATSTRNAVYEVVRRTSPEWYSTSNSVRYVLTHEPAFALWRLEDTREVAGLAEHLGQPPGPGPTDLSGAEAAFRRDSLKDSNAGRKITVVHAIVRAWGGPIPFDTLVNAAVGWLDVQERQPRSLDGPIGENQTLLDILPSSQPSSERRLAAHEAARHAWEALKTLPTLTHKRVLLLNLSGALDASIETFEENGIATIGEIADALEYDREWFAVLSSRLPLPDAEIAIMLDLTPQQVTDRRSSARRTLARRLRTRLEGSSSPDSKVIA